MSAAATATPLIAARGLTKRYGTIVATDGVDIDIGHGEIVAIVGDNGAGKSTLIKMLSGAEIPDEGAIFIDGNATHLRNPMDARRHGIETIYQDLAMAPNLDVVANIYLGRERMRRRPARWLGLIDRGAMREEAERHLAELHIEIARLTGSVVSSLSGGQRQSVAIARAMVWASRLVMMDEPTAALGVAQARAVLEIVKEVRARGMSVAIISHILPHVLEIADRIVVMRHGKKVADVAASEVDEHRLINLIVGIQLDERGRPTRVR